MISVTCDRRREIIGATVRGMTALEDLHNRSVPLRDDPDLAGALKTLDKIEKQACALFECSNKVLREG